VAILVATSGPEHEKVKRKGSRHCFAKDRCGACALTLTRIAAFAKKLHVGSSGLRRRVAQISQGFRVEVR
jgi:hypothetical protein